MDYNFDKISKITSRRFTKRMLFSILLTGLSVGLVTLLILYGDIFPVFIGCITAWVVFGALCVRKIKEARCGKLVIANGPLSRLRIDVKSIRKSLHASFSIGRRRRFDHDFLDLKCAAVFISDSKRKKPLKIYLRGLDTFQVNYYEKASELKADMTHIFAARFPVISVPDKHSPLLCPLCGALSKENACSCPECYEEIYIIN